MINDYGEHDKTILGLGAESKDPKPKSEEGTLEAEKQYELHLIITHVSTMKVCEKIVWYPSAQVGPRMGQLRSIYPEPEYTIRCFQHVITELID